jgi:hypothetical protein
LSAVSLDAIADAAIEATYTALGLTVTYQPLSGAAFAVPVHLGQPPQVLDGLGGGRHLHDGIIVEVLAADLPPGSPAENDQLLLADRRYRVRSARWADSGRLIWEIEAVPA